MISKIQNITKQNTHLNCNSIIIDKSFETKHFFQWDIIYLSDEPKQKILANKTHDKLTKKYLMQKLIILLMEKNINNWGMFTSSRQKSLIGFEEINFKILQQFKLWLLYCEPLRKWSYGDPVSFNYTLFL